MDKSFLTLLCLLFCFSALFSQSFDYGNDWYRADPNRTFVRLVVDQEGIYRVTNQDLISAGVDLSGINPDNLQLYYRGEEVNMYIAQSAGSLIYLEFYGVRNDGRVDSIMYRHPVTGLHKGDLQPNKMLSLFSDESVYFLTWTTSPSGFRYFSRLDPTYSLYTPEPFFRYEAKKEFLPGETGTEYVQGGGGRYDAFFTLNSDYITGEGYMGGSNASTGGSFGLNSPRTISIPTSGAANTSNPLKIKTRIFGRSNSPHTLRVELNRESGNPVIDTVITTSQVYIKTYVNANFFPGSSLSNTTDLTHFALRPNTDNNNICWASITYDHAPDLEGDSTLHISDWDKPFNAYLELANVVGADSVFVYDFQNGFRNVGLMNGNKAQIVIQGFPNSRDLYLATDKGLKKPRIEPANFAKLFDPGAGAEYVIISHRRLTASAGAYATYRDTAQVNPVSVKLVYTDQIYDEYGYGTITPWAIKRFCKDALDNWSVKPKYFLLWGKGKFQVRNDPDNSPQVPTYGYPATDYEFISHFKQYSVEIKPEAAIGRVNIFNDSEGFAYLDKVNDYEHSTWDVWMKEAAFLGGGANEGEQNAIGGAFRFFMDFFEGPPFGGKSIYFQKRTSEVTIDPSVASYHDEISGGVSLVHFFGHSTSNIQDVSIREPSAYDNFSRYPLMIAMGCFGGDFTVTGSSFGERWVKEPKRGAIGYIGNSSAGYLQPLRDYGRVFYQEFYSRYHGMPIGMVIKNMFQTYTDSLIGVQYRNHGRQMNLQGDPAVILYTPQKPDLEVTRPGVYFNPETFTAQDDSFEINIIVRNLGIVDRDSFKLELVQKLPNATVQEHVSMMLPMVRYVDTFSFVINNFFGNAMTGQNFFEVFVDADRSIDEYSENNNQVSLSKVVPGNFPAILYPVEYAIVGTDQVSLQASAFFMTREDNVGYIFEIDTSANFASPSRVTSGLVNGKATFVSWQLPFRLQDSTVYFWRVRLSDIKPQVWGNSSFKYIRNRTGWAQANPDQYKKNNLSRVRLDLLQRKWDFDTYGIDYEFTTQQNGYFQVSSNGSLVVNTGLSGFSSNGVAFYILDHKSLRPKSTTEFPGGFVSEIGVARVPGELHKLKNAILGADDGDYIIVGSNRNPKVQTWSQDVFDVLALMGVSDNIKLLKDGDAFLVMGRKGYPNAATELYAPNSATKFVINNVLIASHQEGKISSTRIGPATNWQQLRWGWESLDPIPQENINISVYGLRFNGADSLIYTGITTPVYDLSSIDAARFPYLRLKAQIADSVSRTAPQLDNWHVFYTPSPDAVVDPNTNFVFESDTVYEGEDIFIHMGAKNISAYNMDSVLVKIYLEREDRTQLVLDSMRITPLHANGNTEEFEYRFNTLNKGLKELVKLFVEINPNGDQPEQYLFNNLYVQPFYVKIDNANPLLDVTIDGKHIIDGDIVSPEPEILIEINDENPLIPVTDPDAFELEFAIGNGGPGSNFEIIDIATDPRVDWTPATLPENKARLYFYPARDPNLPEGKLADGRYTIRVKGRDQKGNVSGRGDNFYKITFEVISESSVTRVLNYPNPFSTSTRFVYTLTGSEIPDIFQIQIYTVTGRQIKVIDLKAMGDVKIGRNITDYAWDGTDEYGDRLANGVYLYRVVLRMQNETLKIRETGTEKFFNNGWGKMYLMR